MPERVLFDTNIVQDLIEKRPHSEEAAALLELSPTHLTPCLSVISLITLAYLNRKTPGFRRYLRSLAANFEIIGVQKSDLMWALEEPLLEELEDDLQRAAAIATNCTHILTQDKQFLTQESRAITPQAYIQKIQLR